MLKKDNTVDSRSNGSACSNKSHSNNILKNPVERYSLFLHNGSNTRHGDRIQYKLDMTPLQFLQKWVLWRPKAVRKIEAKCSRCTFLKKTKFHGGGIWVWSENKKSKKRRKEVVKCASNPSLNAIKNCILFRDKYFSQLRADEGRHEVMHGVPKDSKTPEMEVKIP